MLIAIAACGRLGFTNGETVDASTSQAIPLVCGDHSFNIAFPDHDVDVSAIETPSGLSVTWVPLVGGPLYGIKLDPNWQITSDMSATSIKPGTWYSSSLGFVDDMLVMGESDGGSIKLDTVQSNMSSATEQACPSANRVSKPPFVNAGPDTISLTTWIDGLTVRPFASDWMPTPPVLTEPSDEPVAVTAVTFGATAVVAWSTPTACNVEQLGDMATGMRVQSTTACRAPRLAASETAVAFVREQPDGVYVSVAAPSDMFASAMLIGPNGTSPRIAFDGQRFWISYLDGTQLVVGYLGLDGTLHSTTVAATPAHDAYELTIVGGAPWLIVVDGAGLAAHELCVPA